MDEVRERLLASDGDHRDPFAVAGLELGFSGYVDLVELERDVRAHTFYDAAGALAKVTPFGRVEGDPRSAYG